jgi:hypothetical protein
LPEIKPSYEISGLSQLLSCSRAAQLFLLPPNMQLNAPLVLSFAFYVSPLGTGMQ